MCCSCLPAMPLQCIKCAMKYLFPRAALACALLLLPATSSFGAETNPFLGYWQMTIPGGGAGWLGVEKEGEKLSTSMLWGGGSVFPLESAKLEGDRLVMTREHKIDRRDVSGQRIRKVIVETITATTDGQTIDFTSIKPRDNGSGDDRAKWSGKRQPPMPKAPNLATVEFGEPIKLFNGKDLAGWRLTDPGAVNGWIARDGLLVNTAKQEEGKPHVNFGNLRTDREFEDFNLSLDFRVEKGQNSGVYLRGIYEIQVADSYGQPPNSHGVSGLYSRITPTINASKPPGEWQTMEMTLVDRHLTVVLNGKKVIDNQPMLGCTGGALWSDVTKPGPVYLQGDHTGVEYRNLVLRPVVK